MGKIYSVYVGQYEKSSDSKDDLKKLNNLGYKGYLFSMNNFYTLKVFSSVRKEMAAAIYKLMIKNGFSSFIQDL